MCAKENDVEWSDLRYLLAVHRSRTLSAAARELGVNQSTVGRRLEALEESVGSRLFRRTPEGFFLTPDGERTLAHAERVEEEVLSLAREISGHDERPAGMVRLTTYDAMGTRFLAPRLGAFRARFPDIELQLDLDNKLLNLSRREADLALRLGKPSQVDIVVRRLGIVSCGLYASRDYLKRRGEPASIEALAGHDIIFVDENDTALPEWRWFARYTRDARVVFRCNSSSAMAGAALDGVGIALLFCYLGDPEKPLRRLFPELDYPRELWLAVHRDLQHAARVRAVMGFLSDTMRENQPLLLGRYTK